MKDVCVLQYETAIKAIERIAQVYYRHGVWNKYQLTDTEQVIQFIKNSHYGADVRMDESGTYYVSIPCDADMW